MYSVSTNNFFSSNANYFLNPFTYTRRNSDGDATPGLLALDNQPNKDKLPEWLYTLTDRIKEYANSSNDALTTAKYITNHNTFAALKTDGGVAAWGSYPKQLVDVRSIYTTLQAFAALKNDGTVVAWGQGPGKDEYGRPIDLGGDCSKVQGQLSSIQAIYPACFAFAALKADGSVVAWGHKDNGGDCSQVQDQLAVNVGSIYVSGHAFAALKFDGSIVTWGWQEDVEAAREKATAAKKHGVASRETGA